MRETEITVQVFDDINTIKNKLKNLNFLVIEKYEMTDYYYSKYSMEELKKMPYSCLIKNSLLIRDIKDSNPKIQMVYKDKILDSNNNVISEEKIKVKVDNLENTLKILDLINMTCWCNVNQNMIVYKKDNIEFAIQIIDGLGIFIEYEEDKTMSNLSEYEKINLMKNNLNSLGLNLGTDYSCKKVYMKFLKETKN